MAQSLKHVYSLQRLQKKHSIDIVLVVFEALIGNSSSNILKMIKITPGVLLEALEQLALILTQ